MTVWPELIVGGLGLAVSGVVALYIVIAHRRLEQKERETGIR